MNNPSLEQVAPANRCPIDRDSIPDAEAAFRALGLAACCAAHDDNGVDWEEVFDVCH
jgi:hypothetical protein